MAQSIIEGGNKTPYILYYHAYSICSMMVRYTLALRGSPNVVDDAMIVEERQVEIFKSGQLSEEFLCEINPKGQVPVLANNGVLSRPLPDSLDISQYIAERHQDLLPEAHKTQILQLLSKLHDINYFSVSSKPAMAHKLKGGIEQLMKAPDLSDRYREALKYKLQITEDEKVGGVEAHTVQEEVHKTKILFSELGSLLDPQVGPWIFGLGKATVLDTNLVPFIMRLRDVGMEASIPESLLHYADMATTKAEWNDVMQGRKTIP